MSLLLLLLLLMAYNVAVVNPQIFYFCLPDSFVVKSRAVCKGFSVEAIFCIFSLCGWSRSGTVTALPSLTCWPPPCSDLVLFVLISTSPEGIGLSENEWNYHQQWHLSCREHAHLEVWQVRLEQRERKGGAILVEPVKLLCHSGDNFSFF